MTMKPWESETIEDLLPFCDLGTAPEPVTYSTHMDVRLQRNGRDFRLEFRESPDGITVLPEGRTLAPFSSLLASDEFGGLRRLATQVGILSNMRRAQSRKEVKNKTVFTKDWYVDSLLTADRLGWEPTTHRADSLLTKVVEEGAQAPDSNLATDLIFLTAQAGQGKSSALRSFHQKQAQRYLLGQARRLTFYVDAQGRGLTNLADVLARELNELRINLPHSAVLSLVRRGLITLIVDGFDELVGARGTYEGAFSSLTTFLELLGGRGQIIAAARSAFFTEEYLSRPTILSGETGSHRVTRLELVPWSANDRTRFFERAKDTSPMGLFGRSVEDEFLAIQNSDHSDLLTRPLFSRDVLIATIDGSSALSAASDLMLVSTIADNYIAREVTEKLMAQGRTPILSAVQLRTFFDDLAAEMWALETRELDLTTTRTLMELRCDSWMIDPSSTRIALDRVGTLPFLVAGTEGQHTVLFEHELFFSYFLSATLTGQVFMEGTSSQSSLARARLSQDDASLLAERYLSGGGTVQKGLDLLAQLAKRRHPRQAQILVNCGSIVAAILRFSSRSAILRDIQVQSMVFDGDSFQGARMESARFTGCTFNRVDLRDARIGGEAIETEFYAALVDELSTRVRLSGLDPELPIVQIEQFTHGRSVPVYEHGERDRLLKVTGFLSEIEGGPRLDIDDEVLFVVTQLCRAFDEMNPVGERHTKYAALFDSPAWPQVKDALIELEMIKTSTKSASGPRQAFYRKKFTTLELLAALYSASSNESVEQFWHSVARSS
jgi:uncharacterized protein YjbI with pentapeptide repeats